MTRKHTPKAPTPAPASSPERPVFDNRRLIALMRANDQQAVDRAYQMTFNTEVGRMVLAHHLMECGVGNAIPPDGGEFGLPYAIGLHNAAIALATKAGLDQATIVVAALTGNLEENTHAPEEPPADVAAFEPHADDNF